MENPTFEMHGEGIPGGKSAGNEGIPPQKSWNLLKIFLLSLLACSLTTTITILALSLIFVERTEILRNSDLPAPPEKPGKGVEPKFQFLYHLPKSKVYTFPGGEIQWARFRRDPLDYGSPEEREFGSSLNSRRSQLTFGTLRIRGGGLRAPHWHFNANEHGFLLQGSAWIGVIGPDNSTATTFTVSAGQVVFFPKNTVHWIKNSGARDCLFLLFFSTHQELLTLDVDDAFFETPEDVLARALQPEGGVKFIRTFRRPGEDQAVNLPENLDELVQNSSYSQSPDPLVWRYFYDLQGRRDPGGKRLRLSHRHRRPPLLPDGNPTFPPQHLPGGARPAPGLQHRGPAGNAPDVPIFPRNGRSHPGPALLQKAGRIPEIPQTRPVRKFRRENEGIWGLGGLGGGGRKRVIFVSWVIYGITRV
ncbi:uncharacterized protein LOC127478674 isoform X2 [Manacus candei]|uniref:uncharacterized protein LOC127478674 isoform X2 n=1 Tax=Manacus candei TaxID=415023 RepID=UPI00222611A1|nr:uncharacterized protein LOC127478674 isoform X2 [Manacus candei]